MAFLPSNLLQGGSGYARKITFEQIQLKNVKNAIIIDQEYGDKMANKMAKVHI